MNWGVKGLDRDGVGSWDPEDIGKLVWDPTFTVTPQANQQSIMDLCNGLKTNTEIVSDPDNIKCWILDMNDAQPSDKKLPIADATEFDTALKNFAQNTEAGRKHVADYNLGFNRSTGKLIWMRIAVPSKGNPNESAK